MRRRFEAPSSRVAAVELAKRPPLYILAGHRTPPNVLPIFAVDDLAVAEETLRKRGWKPEGPSVEVPDGPCHVFQDPSGNELAILGMTRPHALEGGPG